MRKRSPENGFAFGGKLYVAKLGRCDRCSFFHASLRAGDVRCTIPKGAPSCVASERADGRNVIFVPAEKKNK